MTAQVVNDISFKRVFEGGIGHRRPERRVEQILQKVGGNLLHGGGAFGDGTITVSGELLEKSVVLSVRDSGPGIAPELLPNLFGRFVTGSETDARVGLGLAIAKSLVEAQGGTISVESQFGDGTVFAVTLPRSINPR